MYVFMHLNKYFCRINVQKWDCLIKDVQICILIHISDLPPGRSAPIYLPTAPISTGQTRKTSL